MWVLPKNLSIYPSAQATEALISDSQELSGLLEQSVLWRSKPSASKTWSRRLKVGGSTPRLFSQTLKLSHGASLLDEWISSQEASLVSHSHLPDEKLETKTQDTSGLTLFEEFENWKNPPLFSSKMLRESSALNSSQTDGQTLKEQVFCTMSLENWKDWVTKQRQEYSVRVKSAHPTKENASSFWVAAPISGQVGGVLFQGCLSEGEKPAAKKRGSSLTVAVNMWNTPAARDYKGVDWNREARGYNPSLPNQAMQSTLPLEAQNSTLGNPQESQWATPNTMDHLPQKSKEVLMRQATTVRKGRTAPSNLREQVNPEAMEIYKQASQWATPQARDYKGSNRRTPDQSQVFGASLPMQMETETKGWATPTARDFEGAYRGAALVRKDGKLRTDTISTQVTLDWTDPNLTERLKSKAWSTPTTRDHKGMYPQWIQEDPTRQTRNLLPDQAHGGSYKGRLNPRWVETLMGLPVGWVMPSCANPWIITQMNLDSSETE